MKFRSYYRRGLASIVGGVFIILIIISAYAFFAMSNIATNDLQKTIAIMSARDNEKKQENLSINNVISDADNLKINIVNNGPKKTRINYVGWINQAINNSDYTYTMVDLEISPTEFLILTIDVDYTLSGRYQLQIISNTGNLYTVGYPYFGQNSASISLLQTNGYAGVLVSLSGSGFTPNAKMSIVYDEKPITDFVPDNPPFTNPSGAFLTSFIVPPSSIGAHSVIATDSNLFFDATTYTHIQSSAQTITNSGVIGSPVVFVGGGFAPNSRLDITFGGEIWGTVTADPSGSIPEGYSLKVPKRSNKESGYPIVINDNWGNRAQIDSFNIIPSISLSPSEGPKGTLVTISGKGFSSTSLVTINTNKYWGSVTTDITGSIPADFKLTVSNDETGNLNVTATDATGNVTTDIFKIT